MEKTLDFGGLWVSDPDQLEVLITPGKVVFPTLLIFCRGGFMLRVNFDIDLATNQTTNMKYASRLYFADKHSILFTGTDADDEISETRWRFRDGGLEFRGDNAWWRYIPVTEEFLTKALQVPPPFFEGVRQGASAGGYVYTEEAIIPGHLPAPDR